MPKKKVVYKIPDGGYVTKDVITGTRHTKNKKTGRMTGRKSVQGVGEKITRKRVKKEFTLVRKSKNARGHIRSTRKDYNPGQFI